MEDSRLIEPDVEGEEGEVSRSWQRGSVRESMMLLCRLRGESDVGASPISIRVRNLSAGGLMAECERRFARGERVEVDLRGVGPVQGTIAWCGTGRLGISFDRAIDPRATRRPVGGGMMTSRIVVAQSGRRPGVR